MSLASLHRTSSKDSVGSKRDSVQREGSKSESTVRELPSIRRMYGMYYAFPTNKSGLWKEEELPEEVMDELRKTSTGDAITSSFRERQREAARRKSDADAEQFEAIRRKSKDLSERMEEEISQLTKTKINLGSIIVGA